MSQPCNKNCNVSQPGSVDKELNEFWSGNPWNIFEQHNLSSFERNRVFINVHGENFLEVSHLTGADIDADSRAVLAVDTRNNGQLDLVLRQAGGGPLRIFENRFPASNFLKVSLRGTQSNRLGIGARLVASVGTQKIVRELYPVNSNQSQAPSIVHFGIGDAAQIDRLRVHWPSGHEQELTDLQCNQHVIIEEGKSQVEAVVPGQRIAP